MIQTTLTVLWQWCMWVVWALKLAASFFSLHVVCKRNSRCTDLNTQRARVSIPRALNDLIQYCLGQALKSSSAPTPEDQLTSVTAHNTWCLSWYPSTHPSCNSIAWHIIKAYFACPQLFHICKLLCKPPSFLGERDKVWLPLFSILYCYGDVQYRE